MNYITVTQLSERWGVTPRNIQNLCRDGRLAGAVQMGKFWMIPEDIVRPADRRYRGASESGKYGADPYEICRSVVGAEYRVPGTKDELIRSLAGNPEAAKLVLAQFAYLNGDLSLCSELSVSLFRCSENFEIKIGAAFLMGICAIYHGDVDSWKNARELLEKLPCPNESCLARKELWLAVYSASIYDMSGYPDWLRRGCFDALPAGYYPAARVHYIKYIYIHGDALLKAQSSDGKEFDGQLFLLPAICEPLISQTTLDKAIVSEIYLRLFCASSYHHAGNDELAVKHIDRALALALPDRIYAPLAEQRLNLDYLVDDRIKIVSSEALDSVRALNATLRNGWSVIHNAVLQRSYSTELTPKELEAARLAVFGMTNNEIAGRMGISINSVKAYLQAAKEKTGAKKRTDLARFV